MERLTAMSHQVQGVVSSTWAVKVTLDEWESFTTRTEAQAAMALLGLDVRKTKEKTRANQSLQTSVERARNQGS
eukprot:2669507-Amphidinium_carterae.2